jgi:hypothetical protein
MSTAGHLSHGVPGSTRSLVQAFLIPWSLGGDFPPGMIVLVLSFNCGDMATEDVKARARVNLSDATAHNQPAPPCAGLAGKPFKAQEYEWCMGVTR